MKRTIPLIITAFLLIPSIALSHSGGTDANGGHHDYNNVSGLGDYHYHHGYGPHLHDGGVCPYDTPAETVIEENHDYFDNAQENTEQHHLLKTYEIESIAEDIAYTADETTYIIPEKESLTDSTFGIIVVGIACLALPYIAICLIGAVINFFNKILKHK